VSSWPALSHRPGRELNETLGLTSCRRSRWSDTVRLVCRPAGEAQRDGGRAGDSARAT
jgi:hypothetical protein